MERTKSAPDLSKRGDLARVALSCRGTARCHFCRVLPYPRRFHGVVDVKGSRFCLSADVDSPALLFN